MIVSILSSPIRNKNMVPRQRFFSAEVFYCEKIFPAMGWQGEDVFMHTKGSLK